MPSIQPLDPGSKAPSFIFQDDGKDLNVNNLRSHALIYFYPKDDTPGCTTEACGLRDAWPELKKAGLKVIGVSGDSKKSHEKFIKKHKLPFNLIADTEFVLAREFGVYGEKKFMGKIYDGIHRVSFLLSPDGTVLKTYPKVKPNLHAAEVLEDFTKIAEK